MKHDRLCGINFNAECSCKEPNTSESDVERLVMLPPYVEPEHRHLIENAEKAVEDYSDMLMDKIKKELFDHGWNLEPHPEDIRKAEKWFHEDISRKALIKHLCRIKMICENPRILIKTFSGT